MLIYEIGAEGRTAAAQYEKTGLPENHEIPAESLRKSPVGLPEVSELQVVRHFTNLSKKNFSIDGEFYPLGSCTMKYNPRGAHSAASIPGFLNRHPLAPESLSQGVLAVSYTHLRAHETGA